MEVAQFCSTSHVVIVAGKGGVGKTTVTAALAVAAARAGLRVLIVEVEGKSGLPAMFGAAALGYDEIDLEPGIRARFLTPDAALVDYLETHGMQPHLEAARARRARSKWSPPRCPGMKDILVLGKVKSLDEARAADLVIVDAPAAGHAITFLLSARGLLDAVRVGPIRKQATDVVALLVRPARCQVMLVTLPEETPVSEAIDTAFAIEDRAGVALGPIVVNGCYAAACPRVSSPRRRRSSRDADALDRFVSPTARPNDLAHAAAFRERALRHPTRADRRGSRDRLPLPQIQLPFVFTPDIGRPRSTCSPTRSRAGSRRCEQPSRRLVDGAAASSSAAAAAASARRRPRRCIALEGARRGRNACVVTIDPAKRLADALGLEQLSDTPSEIDRDRWDGVGTAMPGGRLSALMLDTKSTFDALVTRNAADRGAGANASSRTASTATSPARSAARRSTWRWRSCTSSTTKAAST